MSLLLLGLSFVGAGAYFFVSTHASVEAEGLQQVNTQLSPVPKVPIQKDFVENSLEIVEKSDDVVEKPAQIVDKPDSFVEKPAQVVEKSSKHLKSGNSKLKWLTTQKTPTSFAPSDAHYLGNNGVDVVFTKLDHKRLFKKYLAASAELREKLEPKAPAHPPAPPPAVMAQVSKVADLRDDVRRSAVLTEDAVSERVAKTEELPEEASAAPSAPTVTAMAGPVISSTYGGSKEIVVASAPALAAPSLKVATPLVDPPRVAGPPPPLEPLPLNAPLPAAALTSSSPAHHNLASASAEVVVSAQVFSLKLGLGDELKNYRIAPDYSSGGQWDDAGTGRVSIQKNVRSQVGIIGGAVDSYGFVTTRVDILFEQGLTRQMSIPMFPYEELREFLEKKGFSRGGGLLFVELDGSTDSVNIDARHEGLVYLDDALREVDSSRDFRYLLFAGIAPGLITIDYIRNGYENLGKMVLIEEGVVYYEPNEYLEIGRDIVKVEQRNVLGSRMSGFEGDSSVEHKQFNSFEKITQVGPSRYDLSVNVLPAGTRKYVEFNHISRERPIYLGRWEAKNLVLPSGDYVSHTLTAIGLEDLTGMCLVQVNFGRRVEELFIEGRDGQSSVPIVVDRIYIDEDGQVSETLSALSAQGLFFTYGSGALSFAVKYEDGKEDYLNSYCYESAYLIEQL